MKTSLSTGQPSRTYPSAALSGLFACVFRLYLEKESRQAVVLSRCSSHRLKPIKDFSVSVRGSMAVLPFLVSICVAIYTCLLYANRSMPIIAAPSPKCKTLYSLLLCCRPQSSHLTGDYGDIIIQKYRLVNAFRLHFLPHLWS